MKDDNFDVLEFIERIEKAHFRTNSDTGANSNSLFIWNLLRKEVGLHRLIPDDLRLRQVESSDGITLEDLREFDRLRGKRM